MATKNDMAFGLQPNTSEIEQERQRQHTLNEQEKKRQDLLNAIQLAQQAQIKQVDDNIQADKQAYEASQAVEQEKKTRSAGFIEQVGKTVLKSIAKVTGDAISTVLDVGGVKGEGEGPVSKALKSFNKNLSPDSPIKHGLDYLRSKTQGSKLTKEHGVYELPDLAYKTLSDKWEKDLEGREDIISIFKGDKSKYEKVKNAAKEAIFMAAENSPQVVATMVNPLVGYMVSYAQQREGFIDRASEYGISREKAQIYADAQATINSGIEQFQNISRAGALKGTKANVLIKNAVNKLMDNPIVRKIKSYPALLGLVGGGFDIAGEAGEEGAQGIVENAFISVMIDDELRDNPEYKQTLMDLNLSKPGLLEGLKENLVAGAGAAVGFKMAGAAAHPIQTTKGVGKVVGETVDIVKQAAQSELMKDETGGTKKTRNYEDTSWNNILKRKAEWDANWEKRDPEFEAWKKTKDAKIVEANEKLEEEREISELARSMKVDRQLVQAGLREELALGHPGVLSNLIARIMSGDQKKLEFTSKEEQQINDALETYSVSPQHGYITTDKAPDIAREGKDDAKRDQENITDPIVLENDSIAEQLKSAIMREEGVDIPVAKKYLAELIDLYEKQESPEQYQKELIAFKNKYNDDPNVTIEIELVMDKDIVSTEQTLFRAPALIEQMKKAYKRAKPGEYYTSEGLINKVPNAKQQLIDKIKEGQKKKSMKRSELEWLSEQSSKIGVYNRRIPTTYLDNLLIDSPNDFYEKMVNIEDTRENTYIDDFYQDETGRIKYIKLVMYGKDGITHQIIDMSVTSTIFKSDQELIDVLQEYSILPSIELRKKFGTKIKETTNTIYHGIVNERVDLEDATVQYWKSREKKGLITEIEDNAALLFQRFEGWRNILLGKMIYDTNPQLDRAFFYDNRNLSRDVAMYMNEFSEIYTKTDMTEDDVTRKQTTLNTLNKKIYSKFKDNAFVTINVFGKTYKIATPIYEVMKSLTTIVDKNILLPSVESGLISKDAYNAVKRKLFLTSVDLKKLFNVDTVGIDKVRDNLYDTYKMGKKKISSFESYFASLLATQTLAEEHNRVKQAVAKYAEENPDIKETSVRTPASLVVRIDGVDRYFTVPTRIKELIDPIINNPDAISEVILDIMKKPGKFIRATATGLRPLFIFKNIFRDQLAAALNSRFAFIPFISTLDVMTRLMVSSGMKKFTGNSKMPTIAEFTEIWLKSGGGASYFTSDEASKRGVKSKKGVKRTKGLSIKERIKLKAETASLISGMKTILTKPFKLIEIASQKTELVTRATGFYKQLQFNKSKSTDAQIFDKLNLLPLHESLRITTHFARRGAADMIKAFTSIVPFTNAAIQGTSQTFEKLIKGDSLWYLNKEQKHVDQKYAYLRNIASIAFLSSAITNFWYWNNSPGSDEEEEKIINEVDSIYSLTRGKESPSKINTKLWNYTKKNGIYDKIIKIQDSNGYVFDSTQLKWAIISTQIMNKNQKSGTGIINKMRSTAFPRKEAYAAIPNYDKLNNICVLKINPVKYNFKTNSYVPNYYKFPINDFPKMIKAVSEGVLNFAYGRDQDVLDTTLEALSDISPINFRMFSTLLIAKPFDEILKNTNSFSGRPIENPKLRAINAQLTPGGRTTFVSDFLARANILSSPQIQNILTTVAPGLGGDMTVLVDRIIEASGKSYEDVPSTVKEILKEIKTELSAVIEGAPSILEFKNKIYQQYNELQGIEMSLSSIGEEEIKKELFKKAGMEYSEYAPMEWSRARQETWLKKANKIIDEARRISDENYKENQPKLLKAEALQEELYANLMKIIILMTTVDNMSDESSKELILNKEYPEEKK